MKTHKDNISISQKIKIGKITGDFIFNFAATALPLAILTLIIYPKMANSLGTAQYGIALSVIGYFRMCTGILVSNLGYNRLLEEKNRDSKNFQKIANYNSLLLIITLVTILMTFFVINIMKIEFSYTEYILLGLTVIFLSLDSYLSIDFRIVINFKKVFINKVFLVLGYIIGMVLNTKGYSWLYIFFLGQLFATLYDLFATNLFKESWKIDARFWKVIIAVLTLSIASLIASVSTYFDKLVLFPKLGGSAVAIYATASIIAKIGPNTTGALGSVLLSYFVKMKKFNKKQYFLFVLFITLIAIIGYFICYYLSIYFIKYFYPQLFNESMKLLKVVITIYMAEVFVTLIYPYLLCYCKLHFQIILQAVRLGLYIIFTIPLMNKYGLGGFAKGVLLASLGYVIFMVIIGLITSNSEKV